jgi:hypothetical protein
LKLMANPPHEDEAEDVGGPIRTAGITPAEEGRMAEES